MIQMIRWIPLLLAMIHGPMLLADEPVEPRESSSKLLKQPELPKLTPKQQQEVQHWVRELQRQRTTNRTRAEKQLNRYGSAAVPYLIPVARSRFDLARIAALRVLLKSPRYEASAVALEGLKAENRWVRKLSWQLIEKISGVRSSFPWEDEDRSRARHNKARIWERWVQEQERLRKLEEQRLREQEASCESTEKPGTPEPEAGR